MIRAVVIGSVLALTARGPVAHADPKDDARTHVETAQTAHASGDYNTAYTELRAAYALDPQPELLFALGQVLVKLDRCKEAIRDYKKFLATQRDRDARAITQQAIKSCQATLANEAHHEEPIDKEPDPDPDPQPLPPSVGDQPPSSPPPPPPGETPPGPPAFYADLLGDALVAGGAIAGAVAVVEYLGARSALDDAEHAASLDAYQDRVDAAHAKRTLAIGLGAGGVVLLGLGIAHYLHFTAEHRKPSAVALAPNPHGDGGLVVWQGVW